MSFEGIIIVHLVAYVLAFIHITRGKKINYFITKIYGALSAFLIGVMLSFYLQQITCTFLEDFFLRTNLIGIEIRQFCVLFCVWKFYNEEGCKKILMKSQYG